MTLKHPCSVHSRSLPMPSHSKPQLPRSHPPRHSSNSITTDRKYNVVIFGVSESPQGTPHYTTKHHNYSETSSILWKLYGLQSRVFYPWLSAYWEVHWQQHSSKANTGYTQHNCWSEIYVLTCRSSLPSSVSIKPDHSSSERRVEKILIPERWKLIKAGSDCHSIKINNLRLYLYGHLHGKVFNSTYSLAPL